MTDSTVQSTPAQKRTRATKLQAADKRLRAFQFLRAGATWAEIAKNCNYNSPQAACEAVSSYLKNETLIESDEYRTLQILRYQRKLAALEEQTNNGDAQSINAWVRVMARLDALMGTEATKALDITSGGKEITVNIIRASETKQE